MSIVNQLESSFFSILQCNHTCVLFDRTKFGKKKNSQEAVGRYNLMIYMTETNHDG